MRAPDIGSHLQFSRNCLYTSYDRIFNMSKVAVVRIFSSPRRCRKSSLRSHALRSLISVHSCLNICLFDTQDTCFYNFCRFFSHLSFLFVWYVLHVCVIIYIFCMTPRSLCVVYSIDLSPVHFGGWTRSCPQEDFLCPAEAWGHWGVCSIRAQHKEGPACCCSRGPGEVSIYPPSS